MTDHWIDAFPPATDRQVELSNWRTAPYNRWAFSHASELVPSAPVRNNPAVVLPLSAREADLYEFLLEMPEGPMDFEAWLDATYTDAIVILQGGEVVCERYFGEMDRRRRHILMSVSKSILGLVVGCLVERGVVDQKTLVTSVVPEVKGTAYDGATLRNLLDMRVGVRFDEIGTTSNGLIAKYRKAHLWDPLDIGEAPMDLRSFYRELTAKDGEHEGRFHYASPNTDLLGWAVERLSGMRYADLVSELIWKPMGAEEDAHITVDRLGAPRCAGGFCATARDLARLGRLLTCGGRTGGSQVIPDVWLEDILNGGDTDAWARGDFTPLFPNVSMNYRSKWYIEQGEHPMVFGFGVFGQNLFIEPPSDLVIVKLSSQPEPLSGKLNALTHSGVNQLRALLRWS